MRLASCLLLTLVVACDGGPSDDPSTPAPDAGVDHAEGGARTIDEAGVDDAALSEPDAGAADASVPEASTLDVGPPCARALATGDLRIVEMLIASVAGTGDHGEWIEVESALDCAVDLQGLHGECPRGRAAATFDVTDHLWIPAHGSFVVADSADPAINHYLPGTVLAWAGALGDVLRNKGTTLTLTMGGILVDTVTYPALALTIGASVAFPRDCAPSQRADWTRWRPSTASWFPGFSGTPNAPNVDVTCR